MPTHVYFDLDGTLTDPFEGITRCIIYAVETLGFPRPSDEFLLNCIGPPLYESLPQVVGDDLTLQAVDLYRERFDEIGWLENVPYEGIHDALETIASDDDCTLYVATSKPHIAATRIVEHFGMADYFDRIFGCELDGTRANKVDLLNFAILENPACTDRVMIGDRKHDLIGALANCIRPIGVSYGYGTVDELNAAGAAAIAHSPADIPPIVLNASG
ncbi:MAG TPA: HAD hydrolase-like protein [Woeseiaceae bacterium]|nr:HAD hydrolase-like protein [Woeseiaceae bacterium]